MLAFVQIEDERSARERQEEAALAAARRSQAEQIAGWPARDTEAQMSILLSNRSQLPVYRAVVSRVAIQGSGATTGKQVRRLGLPGEQQTLAVIPPGESQLTFPAGFGGMSRRAGIELAFLDAAGVYWLREADGTLRELAQPPEAYYKLALPLDYAFPSRTR